MSKTTMTRPGSLLCNPIAVEFSLLLNATESMFNLATHWLLPNPNNVIAAGKQPSGGNDVTPIFLAPNPYKFCQKENVIQRSIVTLLSKYVYDLVEGNLNKRREGLREEVWELIRWIAPIQERIYVVILNKVTATSTNEVNRTRNDRRSVGFSCNPDQLLLIILVVLQLLAQRNSTLQKKPHNFRKRKNHYSTVL